MRYIIGIDLGTTNSCLAYLDTTDPYSQVQLLKIPQLTAAGTTQQLSTLPSFCYLAASYEWPNGSLTLPWSDHSDFFVGAFAQFQGAKVPTRLVQSAKSWLCHRAAARQERILPIEAADEASRISPIEATARYLRHLRESWNQLMVRGDVENEFDSQEVILTVPASFDEVARSLTIEAARLAGYVQITLLEEPQAAFYSWIAQHETKWEQLLAPGSTILVCDVGGGTTDFSLIDVVEHEGKRSFQRMSVGDHLLLGGDNMDVALAHLIATKFTEQGGELAEVQHQQLRHEARKAKEVLLAEEQDVYRVILQGGGSSVVQGTKSLELTQREVQQFLLSGFFGVYPWGDAVVLKKKAGVRSMGLPYEEEPSITKHLAHFLMQSGSSESPKRPDYLLFNGGTMKPKLFQSAIIDSLQGWFPEKSVSILPSYSLDLAVGRGAAYYGKVRRGLGVKIGGGTARSYYLVLDIKDSSGAITQQALTLLPRGSEEGAVYEPEHTFSLMPNTPISFQLCTSHVRLHDSSGDLVSIDPEEMHLLAPIHTVLRFGKGPSTEGEKIPVHLQITLTPIGTIALHLKSLKSNHRWALEFQVRSVTGHDAALTAKAKKSIDETLDIEQAHQVHETIHRVFGTQREGGKPEQLMEMLEKLLEKPRKEWPSSVLRVVADALLKVPQARNISPLYAERWWNILGFALRPGMGSPLDDFRIKELWKVILTDSKVSSSQEVQIQQWICYRRIAGGLSKGQQMQLANELISTLLGKKGERIALKSKSEFYPYSEKIRAVSSLELIDASLKIRLGNALIQRLTKGEAISSDYWALGRLSARHLLYGSLAHVVAKTICEKWIHSLLESPMEKNEPLAVLLGQMGRKTGHREVDISPSCIDSVLKAFAGTPYEHSLHNWLCVESQLTQQEQERAFGDHLPAGLLLERD